MADRLELTWVGKENRPRVEPRILLEDQTRSYHAKAKVTEDDLFDNRLIFGDNLLGLRALEHEFAGRVKCIYIDPPFNADAASLHYEDFVEHSAWLQLMSQRFEVMRRLLAPNGSIFVHLDDTEMAYCKILLDEVFGRSNYCNTICMTTNDPSGFKATGSTIFSTANYLLIYARDKTQVAFHKVHIPKEYDRAYSKVLRNPSDHYTKWEWDSIDDLVAKGLGFPSMREARRKLGDTIDQEVASFAAENAERVFRTAAIGGGARVKRLKTIEQSRLRRNQVFVHPNEDVPGFYILNGEQILFYSKRLINIDGKRVPGQLITDVWTDISWTGIAAEGSVEFKNGKKPEALIKRVLELSTKRGELVLDSFAGSGTTGAVAHKMGRKWIMVELGEQCHSHVIPRLRRVIDGSDQSGISRAVSWKGGGGFRYYRIAPSLLAKDEFGNWVVNKQYKAEMLAEAICKLEGYRYDPSPEVYWQHGRSSEDSFIYVTTQTLLVEQLRRLNEDVGPKRSLLICCGSFTAKNLEDFPRLTVKKIPKAVLHRCEWGRDDYSLEIRNLPEASPVNGGTDTKSPRRRAVSLLNFGEA
jgi:adenine-specific DNA-methyltransferase